MKLIVESGQSGLNRAGRYASDGRLRGQVCHFSCFGADRQQNGRVRYELCHTKRRVNADELARIT